MGPKVGRAPGDMARIRGWLGSWQPVAHGEQRCSGASTRKQGSLARGDGSTNGQARPIVGLAQEREEGSWLGCVRKKRKRVGYWAASGEKRRFTPRHFGKIEYLLLFSNVFTIRKPI
jgi:hypothetical protein